jgi:hypothetical protein
VENAPRLYGCSKETVQKLRSRAYPIGALPLAAFLWKFARSHGQSPLDLLGDPAVTVGWYNLISSKDYPSRALLKAGRVLARALG